MTTNQKKSKVYRVQGLPDRPGFDRYAATQLIASAINDPTVTAGDIEIYSLAPSVDPHKIWNRKVATVMFSHAPSPLATAEGSDKSVDSEWRFPVPGFPEPLVLDSHFLGLTVLNDVSATEHRCDCIVLSGLASHPFGSWQPKGDNKSYMWIRDTLPTSMDGVRFILFGYDTTLKDSDSFQTIVDLSNSLYLTLQTNGWASPSTKPLVFLAHSLGGVLLKQLLVILAGANENAQFMLSIIKGAIFFGTPSRGMALAQLLTMVGDRPNKGLVEHLSETSSFLPNLETQFAGISHLQRMNLCWAYETKTSPTVEKIDGIYKRSGPRSIMVDHQSATGYRTLNPSSTIQIDEDHSHMVKFNVGDRRIPIIINKIREICFLGETPHRMEPTALAMNMSSGVQYESDTSYARQDLLDDARNSELVGWDYDLIISVLRAPERDQRYGQIVQNVGHTFSWAFETQSIGLSQWLREGEGIFWINGKPGSGKSTFMKFLLDDDRTKEFLHYWRSMSGQIIASFFFHHRGTHLQKSFEGLLGSLLSQLLEGDVRLRGLIGDFLSEKSTGLYEAVQSDVKTLFQLCNIKSDSTVHQKHMVTLLCENPSLKLHRLLQDHVPYLKSADRSLIKKTLLRDFDGISHATSDKSVYAAAEQNTLRKLLPTFTENEEKIKFIIRSWSESLDISGQVGNFLTEAELKPDNKQHITRLIGRQRARQKRQISIQLMQWTQSDLEQGLRRVFDQDAFDLEVCLFLDALDEYAGSPEVVSAFLKDLVKAKLGSKTRTKILFSSRPWTVFRDHFGTCPSFSIHEHTLEDIHEYCASSLPECSRIKALIRPFVGDIANRARGVFVWVRLVMTDLVSLVTATNETDEELPQKLRHCLDSLPDELEEYYSAIIHRLPASTRKQTYILLECLSRSSDIIYLSEVPELLACGMSDSLSEALVAITNENAPGFADPEGHVGTISGGIIDIVAGNGLQYSALSDYSRNSLKNKRDCVLQLMHQTVKDWMELPTFKHTVLGTRADMTPENGHNFLVKFYTYVNCGLGKRSMGSSSGSAILDHAVQAEMTTGVSQYMYLSRLPANVLGHVLRQKNDWPGTFTRHPDIPQRRGYGGGMPVKDIDWLSSTGIPGSTEVPGSAGGPSELGVPGKLTEPPGGLGIPGKERVLQNTRGPSHVLASGLYFAVVGGLSLYLADSVQHDSFVFQRSSEPLVSILLELVLYKSAVQQSDMVAARLESAKLILNNGFRIQLYPDAFSLMFEGIWRSPNQQTAVIYADLVWVAVRNGLSVATLFGIGLDPGSPTSVLHLSPPTLAEYLLEKGANPNRLNGAGQTPLDYILEPDSVFQRSPFGLDWLYDVVRLLIKNGAQRRKGTRHSQRLQGHKLLQRLNDSGYDIGPLLSLQSQSLSLDEQSIPPSEPGNGVADVPPSDTSAGQETARNRLARLFGGSGGFFRW
ncbi:hypothetical protein PFICI_11888 [Pestalotiopsis fici W106-1]|uniref:Nephrocystin 3-like N-terminal domain-containing protein n=1 Tax=Pestalotiopsis fici (strain W106-1 / CGMCC3.15140) TaxID=1229662 RepID=W3WUF8_PESFW|nr:uncharacterized protein PFICI_11888 [Pestalotiopsis fici W106-1]ETS76501.1 hypothetical protein PFICI_11888 [Pestalotiopsis fici W106-1]